MAETQISGLLFLKKSKDKYLIEALNLKVRLSGELQEADSRYDKIFENRDRKNSSIQI